MITASEAARALGSIRSERKAIAIRENGKKGGRRIMPLEQITCNCGGRD